MYLYFVFQKNLYLLFLVPVANHLWSDFQILHLHFIAARSWHFTNVKSERTLNVTVKCYIAFVFSWEWEAGHNVEVCVNPSVCDRLLMYFLTWKLCEKITVNVQVRPKIHLGSTRRSEIITVAFNILLRKWILLMWLVPDNCPFHLNCLFIPLFKT